jgi:hypothetical protein
VRCESTAHRRTARCNQVLARHGLAPVRLDGERRRVRPCREPVRVIAGKPTGLRAGLTRATATGIRLLFSADVYQSIGVGRGWSAARTRKYLHDVLSGELLND